MRKSFFFLFTGFTFWFNSARAQTAEDSVKAVVNNLFLAMKNADSALFRKCFEDSAILQTIDHLNEQNASVDDDPIEKVAAMISLSEKNELDERIVFEFVKAEEDLATVWTTYNFFYKGKFSHCGVNSFQLVKLNNEWKIQYLIDTRHKHCK